MTIGPEGIAAALGAAEADALFADLPHGPLLLAVSGGPDSTAMMGLAADWARRAGAPAPHVAVVDHGLRDVESEIELVVTGAGALCLPVSVLRWKGPRPASGIQEAARRARYGLLVDHAKAMGLCALLTAHTLDDQAETVLMRLAAGSGVAGMAGMRRRGLTLGLAHWRPFLDVEKARLVATCAAHGWRWALDPGNADPRFARSRWRHALPLLAREGLTAKRLALFARRAAEADEALDAAARAAFAACRAGAGDGPLRLDALRLAAEPAAIARRVLGLALEAANPGAGEWRQELRLQRIEACARAFADAAMQKTRLSRTLGGCLLALGADGTIEIVLEPQRKRGCVNPVGRARLGKDQAET
jgi:tRNA(Ile)-lysidine synthase